MYIHMYMYIYICIYIYIYSLYVCFGLSKYLPPLQATLVQAKAPIHPRLEPQAERTSWGHGFVSKWKILDLNWWEENNE